MHSCYCTYDNNNIHFLYEKSLKKLLNTNKSIDLLFIIHGEAVGAQVILFLENLLFILFQCVCYKLVIN